MIFCHRACSLPHHSTFCRLWLLGLSVSSMPRLLASSVREVRLFCHLREVPAAHRCLLSTGVAARRGLCTLPNRIHTRHRVFEACSRRRMDMLPGLGTMNNARRTTYDACMHLQRTKMRCTTRDTCCPTYDMRRTHAVCDTQHATCSVAPVQVRPKGALCVESAVQHLTTARNVEIVQCGTRCDPRASTSRN